MAYNVRARIHHTHHGQVVSILGSILQATSVQQSRLKPSTPSSNPGTGTSQRRYLTLMASVTDIIAEIQDAARLLAKRSSDGLSMGLINSIAMKMGTVSQWTTKVASRMADAIAETSLDDQLKKVLHEACDKRLAAYIDASVGPTSRPASGAPTRDQTLRHIGKYFAASDYAIFDDPASTSAQRDATATARLESLGVRRPSETGLIKWLTSFLLDCEFRLTQAWPSYWTIYNRVQSLKGLLHGLPPYAGTFVDRFPELPRDLPKDVFDAAYDLTEPPIVSYIPKLEEISRHVPLRKTSQLLTQESGASATNLGQGSDVAQLTLLRALEVMGVANQRRGDGIDIQYLGKYAEQDRSWSGSSWSSPAADWRNSPPDSADQHVVDNKRQAIEWKPFEKKPRSALALANEPHAPAPEAASCDVNPWTTDADPAQERASTADIEDAAYAALLARKKVKKTTTSASVSVAAVAKTAVVAKTPAAQTIKASVAKKPATLSTDAGVAKDIGYPRIKWNLDDRDRSRNAFGSLHYCRAKTIIKQKYPEMADDAKRATLSAIHTEATDLWDKHMKKLCNASGSGLTYASMHCVLPSASRHSCRQETCGHASSLGVLQDNDILVPRLLLQSINATTLPCHPSSLMYQVLGLRP